MLIVLGFVAIIVAAILAYRTAKEYERNAFGWTLVVIGVGLGIQFVIPFMIGLIVGIVVVILQGRSVSEDQFAFGLITIISIICFVASIGAMLLILRFLGRVPEEKSFVRPPLPPTF